MASLSNYPTELDDTSSIPKATDDVTEITAVVANRLRDAVIAIETELGTDPSREFGTVRARLDDLRSVINTILAELGTNPSGTFDTVVARLDDINAQLNNINFASQIIIPLISGTQEENSSTPVAKGAVNLNLTDAGYPNITLTLVVILQTTDTSYAASFQLRNVTEGVTVSHDAISTTESEATLFKIEISGGGSDLPAEQDNVIEGRLSLASGAPSEARAVCKYAAIVITPT